MSIRVTRETSAWLERRANELGLTAAQVAGMILSRCALGELGRRADRRHFASVCAKTTPIGANLPHHHRGGSAPKCLKLTPRGAKSTPRGVNLPGTPFALSPPPLPPPLQQEEEEKEENWADRVVGAMLEDRSVARELCEYLIDQTQDLTEHERSFVPSVLHDFVVPGLLTAKQARKLVQITGRARRKSVARARERAKAEERREVEHDRNLGHSEELQRMADEVRKGRRRQ